MSSCAKQRSGDYIVPPDGPPLSSRRCHEEVVSFFQPRDRVAPSKRPTEKLIEKHVEDGTG